MIGKNKKLIGFIFILPGTLLLLFFVIIPIIMSIYYGFTKWDGFGSPKWVGISNYIKLFRSTEYMDSLKNNAIFFILALFAQNTLAYILAILVNSVTRLRRTFVSVFFFPVVISSVATAFMFVVFLNGDTGAFNVILKPFGLNRSWLSDGATVLPAVIFTQLWQYIGIHFMIYYAAISNVSSEILESAALDGTGAVRRIFSIVIPCTWETIITAVIFSFVGCIKSFDYPWIMTRGGPGTSSEYIGVFLFKQAFSQTNYGLASSAAITILVYALTFSVIFKAAAGKCFQK